MAIADKLTDEERGAALRLMVALAAVDGHVAEAESRALERMAAGLRLELSALLADPQGIDKAGERAKLSRPLAAKVAVICLVQLASADGDYSREERDEVVEQVDLLGVDIALLDQIEAWVERGVQWELDADALLD